MRLFLILSLITLPVVAAPPTTCRGSDVYSKALCAYQHRDFATAETGFRSIIKEDLQEPQTIKSYYFLARTLMKTGRYDDAGELFRRIYDIDRPFYESWQCDYLLGECRRAVGK